MHSWVWIKHQHDIKDMRKSTYREKNYTYCLDSFWNDFFSAEKGISNILIVLQYFSQGAKKRFSTT